jgi:hypothetical protein
VSPLEKQAQILEIATTLERKKSIETSGNHDVDGTEEE